MATISHPAGVDQIGDTAGILWRILAEQGPLSLAKLVKEADLHRDLVMQAIGRLAREDKVTIEEEARAKVVYLR